jgi:gluconolactonase
MASNGTSKIAVFERILQMIFARDLGNPEGPVLMPDNSWLVAEMRPDRGCVTHISSDGKTRRVVAKTGRPNGLTRDKDGLIWVAESVNPPSLLRMTMDGKYDVVMTECDGQPFLFPNDLRFGPDGALYMTDSGVPFKEWSQMGPEQRGQAQPDGRLYRIDPRGKTIQKLDSGIRFANGIAFGPDRNLYVSATVSGMVYRYEWRDSRVGKREDFGNVVDPSLPTGFRGPDGMAFGMDGNLYVTVSREGDVAVLNPEGKVIRRLKLEGPSPTNIAFGPRGSGKIYVTEQGIGYLEVHDVETDGLPLYD